MSIFGSSHLSNGDLTARDDDPRLFASGSINTSSDSGQGADEEGPPEEDHVALLFRDLYSQCEPKITALFDGSYQLSKAQRDADAEIDAAHPADDLPAALPAPKKAARTIDEDDYDDDEEEDGEDETRKPFPTKLNNGVLPSPSKSGSSPARPDLSPVKISEKEKQAATSEGAAKTVEAARKMLEAQKKETEEAVKRRFNTIFYTLENDRIAMLEQQRLEESEKQIESEMDSGGNANAGGHGPNGEQHGTLSSANLGASSLTLKHLIARIDAKRDAVQASDAELRSLMNEVRKNRSKWASEENVNQEELYEASEKVLTELKAMTEYSAPFLTRVNKREAPDYYNIIKTPMDLGTMTKKLKTLVYKSKAEFVADLNLIWGNCLKYNGDLTHPLRRNANSMRKEAEKLVPLIPDLVIRPRAEVEAEERMKANGAEDDGADESDEEPIMSSRGHKAGTGIKGSTKARKAVTERATPGAEQKPVLHLNGIIDSLRHEGSDIGRESSTNGFGTPTHGTGSLTPGGINGAGGSQVDSMDIDGPSINGASLGHALGAAAEELEEDEEYKIWKQVTKKDRALAAKERHLLFKGDTLSQDSPALLRSKAGMRKWLRHQDKSKSDKSGGEQADSGSGGPQNAVQGAETLAEGMEASDEKALPDYYDPLSAIPDVTERLRWVEDDNGQVLEHSADFLRMIPAGHFKAPHSNLTSRIETNMRQMQETRKICSKIGVVKQMQLQSQMYNNQFQKYNPEPFLEADIEPHVTTDDGPVMSLWACQAALQRSVGKICYHAGFEELQPSALDVMTTLAADYFGKLARTFGVYREAPRITATGVAAESGAKWVDRFSNEELILHTLGENGLDVENLESYAKDDNERFGNKLTIMHERMKAHLADLLRPALSNDAGADGVGAFNDGSEQFVGGDFAEDLGEDFFGFKELGLDQEFGLSSMSVPLHLLQAKVHNLHNANGAAATAAAAVVFEALPPLSAVTKENIQSHIGLVKNFFLAKLHANGDAPLIEDEDLPTKQRFPKPRLPPTGKITSPRKRPLKEQAGNAKKKKKLENGLAVDATAAGGGGGGKLLSESPEKKSGGALKKLKMSLANGGGVSMERVESSQGNASQTEKDDASAVGMMSPESIER